MSDIRYRRRGTAIIETERGIILTAGHRGSFILPGGGAERGESRFVAAIRELKEETGIETIKIAPGFRKKTTYFFTSFGETIAKTVSFYLAETFDEKIKLSHEHSEFEWLPFNQAMERLSFENTKNLLREAQKFLNQKNK